MKRCSVCCSELELSAFGVDRSAKGGLKCTCSKCLNIKKTAFRRANGVMPKKGMYPTNLTKICPKCKIELSLDQFGRNGKKIRASCKSCQAKAFEAWSRARGSVTRAELQARQRANRKCRDCGCSLPPDWRRGQCKPCRSLMEAVNYAKRKEAMAIRRKAYREANPAKVQAWALSGQHRRMGHRNRDISPADWQWVLDTYGDWCLRCGDREQTTIDHVTPVSKGGTSERSNLQPLCLRCNASKHTKVIDYRPWARAA